MKKMLGYVVKVKNIWDEDFKYYFYEKLNLAKIACDTYRTNTTATICELYADCENGKMTVEPMDY